MKVKEERDKFSAITPVAVMDEVLGHYNKIEQEPCDLGQLTGMHGTAMINDEEYKFQIKDFTINVDHGQTLMRDNDHHYYTGPTNKTITLTGIL